MDDHTNKGIILGDALSIHQGKDTLASVEELQNLAGGADIKVLLFLDFLNSDSSFYLLPRFFCTLYSWLLIRY